MKPEGTGEINSSFHTFDHEIGQLDLESHFEQYTHNYKEIWNDREGIQASIEAYKKVGSKTRDMDFLINNWLGLVYTNLFFLSSIDPIYKPQLVQDKIDLTLFAILLDDLADNIEHRDRKLLAKAITMPYMDEADFENEYLNVTWQMWSNAIQSIKKYPRYQELKDIFRFDLNQFLDSIRYAFLMNEYHISNSLEDKIYTYHNMINIVFLDMDLMCSPSFDKSELPHIRPIFHWIQDINHVGNILTTYTREIIEQDFSSPIIAQGIREGLITKDDVIRHPDYAHEKLKSLVPQYIKRAEDDFHNIEYHAQYVSSVDILEFASREKMLFYGFLERGPMGKGVER